jgi:hypothetical protein
LSEYDIEKVFGTRNYEKIKLILDYHRDTKLPDFKFEWNLLDGLARTKDFDIIKRIFDEYEDLLSEAITSRILYYTLDGSEPALVLKEHVLETIEEKKIPIDRIAISAIISTLDVDTMNRILNMKHIDYVKYRLDAKFSRYDLISNFDKYPTKSMEMIKLLNQYYDITHDREWFIQAVRSVQALRFLISMNPDARCWASALLLDAAYYGQEDVIKYIMNELGPIKQHTLDKAVRNAYTHGRITVAKLLEEYGGARPANPDNLYQAPF